MGFVLAVVSGKGGTGKTSLCAALAACLGADGSSVLAMDCDVGMRNLDISLAMSQEATMAFTAVMEDERCWNRVPAHPTLPNLHLLTAPVTCRAEDLEEKAFAQMLREARERYDWCILDAPAGIGAGFALCATYADQILVVATADPASLRDGARAAEEAEKLGANHLKMVVNRVSTRFLGITKFTIDDAMDQVALPLLGLVPEDRNVSIAAAKGRPLVLQTSRGASLAALNIARRLSGKRIPLGRKF